MTDANKIFEQQTNRFEAQLKHIDGLLERATTGFSGSTADSNIHSQIENVKSDRDRLAQHIASLKQGSSGESQEEKIKKAGPMAMWEALALQLESLLERIERK